MNLINTKPSLISKRRNRCHADVIKKDGSFRINFFKIDQKHKFVKNRISKMLNTIIDCKFSSILISTICFLSLVSRLLFFLSISFPFFHVPSLFYTFLHRPRKLVTTKRFLFSISVSLLDLRTNEK